MAVIASALDFISSHYHGHSILLHSDSLRFLTYISSSYRKSYMWDTKLCLLRALRRACQVSTIKLVHVPGHPGIWKNETVDKLAKQVPKISQEYSQVLLFQLSLDQDSKCRRCHGLKKFSGTSGFVQPFSLLRCVPSKIFVRISNWKPSLARWLLSKHERCRSEHPGTCFCNYHPGPKRE